MDEQEAIDELREKNFLVATVVISGSVTPEYAQAREDLRVYNERAGFTQIEYRNFDAKLVEAGRDEAVKHALAEGYDGLLQIDADATFSPDAFIEILKTAYLRRPQSDAVGAYANLAGPPYLPTLDTGTGTWEEWYPNSGIVPVIRTGAHFLFTKRSAFEKMGAPPWFRTRLAERPVDALADTDNFARMKLDGRNPLTTHPEWHTLVAEAREQADSEPSAVGEDSSFCDRLRAAGGQIFVDTGIVCGHVTKKEIDWTDFKDKMEEREEMRRIVCGVLG